MNRFGRGRYNVGKYHPWGFENTPATKYITTGFMRKELCPHCGRRRMRNRSNYVTGCICKPSTFTLPILAERVG